MTTNQPTFDLNTIIQAALSAAIAQSTAALAARVDNLEQQLATQSDTIGALVRGLEAAERGIERLDSVVFDVNGVVVAPQQGLSWGSVDSILADVRKAIADAIEAHERTETHLTERDIEGAMSVAIETHERDAEHHTESEIDEAIAEALRAHERDTEHGGDFESDAAHEAISDVVRELINDNLEVTVRLAR